MVTLPSMSLAVDQYKIRLEGIRFRGRHGVSDSERALPQDFLVTVEVLLPVSALPQGDHIRDVFDYDRLATLVVDVGTAETCRLLETLARRVIQRVLADTPASRVSVSVTKSRPPTHASVDNVTVELCGTRDASDGE
jgi:7,8-dihydroneopterin aldolase/epimerase/oxygenase